MLPADAGSDGERASSVWKDDMPEGRVPQGRRTGNTALRIRRPEGGTIQGTRRPSQKRVIPIPSMQARARTSQGNKSPRAAFLILSARLTKSPVPVDDGRHSVSTDRFSVLVRTKGCTGRGICCVRGVFLPQFEALPAKRSKPSGSARRGRSLQPNHRFGIAPFTRQVP